MSAESPPYVIQASSHGAALFRQVDAAQCGFAQPGTLTSASGGVSQLGDLAVTQNGTPNMSVNVAGGSCWIPQTIAANGGVYFGLNDATVNLAISAANATNPRIDTVVASVNDAAYSGSTNNWVLQVLTGTPTAGATLSNLNGKAALSASSIVIAYVLVPANATTIVTADLLDKRVLLPLFSGKLLGITQYAPGTQTGYALGGSFSTIDSTNLVVPFSAPPSGSVVFSAEFFAAVGANAVLQMGVESAGAQIGGAVILDSGAAALSKRFHYEVEITGLTPGASYTFGMMGGSFNSVASTIYVGGNGTGGNTTNNAGLALLKVTAV